MSGRITEKNPQLFVLMLDQSASMELNFGGDHSKSKSTIVAKAVNELIEELGLKSMSNQSSSAMKDKFEIALISYYTDNDWNPIIGGAYEGPLKNKEGIVTISELFDNPAEDDDDPVWVFPRNEGCTPMKGAIRYVYDLVDAWIDAHQDNSPRPIILNITDGMATDMTDTYEYTDLGQEIQSLKSLSTDENVLFFNLFLCEESGSAKYPTSDPEFNQYCSFLFKHTSVLTDDMKKEANSLNYKFDGSDPRGFVVNGSSEDIIRFLKIGTTTETK